MHNTQVLKCLQPMMLCLSNGCMLRMIDRFNKTYDESPLQWKDELLPHVKVWLFSTASMKYITIMLRFH